MSPLAHTRVILFVGATLILSVIGIIALSWNVVDVQGQRIPDVLQIIATGSLTGLLGLIVNPKAP